MLRPFTNPFWIKNALKILKPNKSPGEDGIISEFYITHWEQIKDEFFLLVNDTFEKKELTPSLPKFFTKVKFA
jgi:hypothetical protein